MLYDPFVEGTLVPTSQQRNPPAPSDAQARVGKSSSNKTINLMASAALSNLHIAQDGTSSDTFQTQKTPLLRSRCLLAMQATFMFSSLWHQILFFYLTGSFIASWRWLLFFTLQGPLVAAEGVVKRLWRERVGVAVPVAVKVVVTNALLALLADVLFMQPLREHGVVQAMVEEALGYGRMLGVVQ